MKIIFQINENKILNIFKDKMEFFTCSPPLPPETRVAIERTM